MFLKGQGLALLRMSSGSITFSPAALTKKSMFSQCLVIELFIQTSFERAI